MIRLIANPQKCNVRKLALHYLAAIRDSGLTRAR
jgi:hypothetical protein